MYQMLRVTMLMSHAWPEVPQKEDPRSQCGLPPLGDMALEPPRNWWEGKEGRFHIKNVGWDGPTLSRGSLLLKSWRDPRLPPSGQSGNDRLWYPEQQ